MGIQIGDGRGSGSLAEVKNNRLQTKAVTESELHDVSEELGLAFSWTSDTYDYLAADTILLVKNTSDKNLSIDTIICSGDAATEVIIHRPTTEVTPTGTAITGRNLNQGSANVAEATAIRDETNNSQGNILLSFRIGADSPYDIHLEGAIILAKNQSIGVDFVANGAAANVTIIGFFD